MIFVNSKHLVFKEKEPKPKTRVFQVFAKTNNDFLGTIKWNPSWRQYCFFTTNKYETVWSKGCLEDLRKFILNIDCVCGHSKRNHANNGKGSCNICRDRNLCEEYDGE